MSPRRGRPVAFLLGLALLAPAPALGDGGLLRAWKRQGVYEVAVFTDPTPVVTGPVDVSVLLLDVRTGEPVPEARVVVDVTPAGRPGGVSRHPATAEAATNKLLRAAVFELRDPGRCEFNIRIDGRDGPARVRFELDIGRRWAPRGGIWPWILWPLPVVALYALHRRLAGRGVRPRR